MSEDAKVYRIFGKNWEVETCDGKELDCNYKTEFILKSDHDSALELLESKLTIAEKKFIKTLQDEKSWLENAPLESGVCCCGSTNCNPMVDGHSFVDSGHYAISNRIKSIDAELASIKESGV